MVAIGEPGADRRNRRVSRVETAGRMRQTRKNLPPGAVGSQGMETG